MAAPPKDLGERRSESNCTSGCEAQWVRETRGAGKLKEPNDRVAARQAQWRKRNADPDKQPTESSTIVILARYALYRSIRILNVYWARPVSGLYSLYD